MAKSKKIKIFYDKVANSLVVWFDEPQKAVISEESGGEVVFMKDKDNNVIGFEKLNFLVAGRKEITSLPVKFEEPKIISP